MIEFFKDLRDLFIEHDVEGIWYEDNWDTEEEISRPTFQYDFKDAGSVHNHHDEINIESIEGIIKNLER